MKCNLHFLVVRHQQNQIETGFISKTCGLDEHQNRHIQCSLYVQYFTTLASQISINGSSRLIPEYNWLKYHLQFCIISEGNWWRHTRIKIELQEVHYVSSYFQNVSFCVNLGNSAKHITDFMRIRERILGRIFIFVIFFSHCLKCFITFIDTLISNLHYTLNWAF